MSRDLRNILMGIFGLGCVFVLYIYFTVYGDIMDDPYMVFMSGLCIIGVITSVIYFINISKHQFRKIFRVCSHDYHLVNQFEKKSEYDIVHESGRTPNTHCSMKRVVITDYKCSKCGKVKRLTA